MKLKLKYLLTISLLTPLYSCALVSNAGNSYMQHDLNNLRKNSEHAYIYNNKPVPLVQNYDFTPLQQTSVNTAIKKLKQYISSTPNEDIQKEAFFIGYTINKNQSLKTKVNTRYFDFIIYYYYIKPLAKNNIHKTVDLLTNKSKKTDFAFDGGEYDNDTIANIYPNAPINLYIYYTYISSKFTKKEIAEINRNIQNIYIKELKRKVYSALNHNVCNKYNMARYKKAAYFTHIIKRYKHLHITPYQLAISQPTKVTKTISKKLLFKVNEDYYNFFYDQNTLEGLYYSNLINSKTNTTKEQSFIFNKMIHKDYKCYLKLK